MSTDPRTQLVEGTLILPIADTPWHSLKDSALSHRATQQLRS